MKTVIFDGLESKSSAAEALKSMIKENCEEFSDFKLRDMNILPCRSCGSCGCQTPGICVISDDMPKILRAFAPSTLIVFFTPIRFGGYSSQLKKALDRLMVVGAPLYEVKKGHLLHPMRYGDKAFLVIGFVEESIEGQEDAFRTLVDHNALNMQLSYNKALIFKPSDNLSSMENELSKVLGEVRIG